jgi:hypothetical protein
LIFQRKLGEKRVAKPTRWELVKHAWKMWELVQQAWKMWRIVMLGYKKSNGAELELFTRT